MMENEGESQLQSERRMILAGDIGGTSTRFGLFEPAPVRPRPLVVRTLTTLAFAGLPDMVRAFAADPEVAGAPLDAACFGVAGPVLGETARLTNVPWTVETSHLRQAFGIRRAVLLNDLQAMAFAVPVLEARELHPLQQGQATSDGNMALIAAGTGLGQAMLHRVDGRLIPFPSEAGHADYAARTERDIVLLRDLTQRFGRAEVEQVVSGLGLVNIHRVVHTTPCLAASNAPRDITAAALGGRCPGCVETLDLFVEAYGAEAGNLAVRSVSTGGFFIGGGIAPKILPALADGRFLRAFLSKDPMRELLTRMPVSVILNEDAGLLGAAVHGMGLLGV
jgi:glucokinase